MRVIAAVAVLALSACSVLDVAPDCPVGADIVFSPQTAEFSWTPSCTVDVIQVVRHENLETYWLARGRITPPIRYGVAVGSGGAEGKPLEPGREFTVFLIRESDSGSQIGSSSFLAPFPTR